MSGTCPRASWGWIWTLLSPIIRTSKPRKRRSPSCARPPRPAKRSTWPPTRTGRGRPSPGTYSRCWTCRRIRPAESPSMRSPARWWLIPSPTPGRSTKTWWMPSRPGGYWTASWATSSPRCCGRRSAGACPPDGSNRWPPGWWWSGRRRSAPSSPRSTGPSPPTCLGSPLIWAASRPTTTARGKRRSWAAPKR